MPALPGRFGIPEWVTSSLFDSIVRVYENRTSVHFQVAVNLVSQNEAAITVWLSSQHKRR